MIKNREVLHELVDKIDDYDSKLVYDFLVRLIKKEKQVSLTEYLNENCDYVDEKEQKELSRILSETKDLEEGREIDIELFLQGKI